MTTVNSGSGTETREADAVVVGAGWAGMYMIYRLRQLGLDVVGVEAGGDVGGTWYWNRYPGARCDVPSQKYSYSFTPDLLPDWSWTEEYATQPEIERYAQQMADRFGVRDCIWFDTQIVRAEYDGAAWSLRCSRGRRLHAPLLFMATGGYSHPITPDIPGFDDFAGETLWTARWPQRPVDLAGRRVGVIGAGSSGVQTSTAIAEQDVEHLYVFQRTPNYAVPSRNHPLSDEERDEFRRNRVAYWAAARQSGTGTLYDVTPRPVAELSEDEFVAHMDSLWRVAGTAIVFGVSDLLTDERANQRVADYLRARIRERVKDPLVADKLCPTTHLVGSRRLVVESGYYEKFNQPNVTLVDVAADPIERITRDVVVVAGEEIPLDVLVLATGFDSGSGAVLAVDPVGVAGEPLSRQWSDGPSTYLGVRVSGFPNLFVLAGPGSPSADVSSPTATSEAPAAPESTQASSADLLAPDPLPDEVVVKVGLVARVEPFAGVLAGEILGEYAKENIKIEYVELPASDILLQVNQGAIDISPNSFSAGFLNAILQGFEIKFVAPAQYSAGESLSGLFVLPEFAENPEQLRGQRVGINSGAASSNVITLGQYLESIGLTVNDVVIDSMTPDVMTPALEQGEIAMAYMTSPRYLDAVERGVAVSVSPAQPGTVMSGLVVGPSIMSAPTCSRPSSGRMHAPTAIICRVTTTPTMRSWRRSPNRWASSPTLSARHRTTCSTRSCVSSRNRLPNCSATSVSLARWKAMNRSPSTRPMTRLTLRTSALTTSSPRTGKIDSETL
jgi:cyclohexanone monooxygenase